MTREEKLDWLCRLRADFNNGIIFTPWNKEFTEALTGVLEQELMWIPVSERLPEEGTYLICTDKGYIATIMYDRSMGWLLNANIIAWMPLPQPYKAESEDKE